MIFPSVTLFVISFQPDSPSSRCSRILNIVSPLCPNSNLKKSQQCHFQMGLLGK